MSAGRGFRAVLIGCGQMSGTWLSALEERADVRIVGLVDRVPDAAKRLAERHGLDCPRFEHLAQALETTGADLVLDVCLPETRFQIVTTALEAGCHVLSEKPMATSLADARAAIACAERRDARGTGLGAGA